MGTCNLALSMPQQGCTLLMPPFPLNLQSKRASQRLFVGRSQGQWGRVLPNLLDGPESFCRFSVKLQLITVAIQEGRQGKG